MTATLTALQQERYELAALRLLLGVLTAVHDTAPSARESLITLLTFEVDGEVDGEVGGDARGKAPR